jgi:uncharacterized membrane protein SpoIIM required for sporulation
MALFKWIIACITDERVRIRVLGMYVSFFLTYYIAMVGGYFLLPEAIFQGKHPIISRIQFSTDPFVSALQIFGYNLIPSCLIIGANLIAQQSRILKEKFVPIGYSAFWGLALTFGLVTGTWSFDVVTEAPTLQARFFRLFDVVHHSGLLEFSCYLLLAVGSFRFTRWYSDGKKIVRSRSWKEIELSIPEKVLFVVGFAILFIAALVESRGIIQIAT